MALLVFCISAQRRHRMYKIVKISSILMAGLSILYILGTTFSLVRHFLLLHDLMINYVDDLFTNLILLGFVLLVLAVASWRINSTTFWQPLNPSLRRSHVVWTILAMLSCASVLLCLLVVSKVLAAVEPLLVLRYKNGLKRYLEDLAWQRAIDRIQAYLACCGADSYNDWYSTAWVPLSLLPGDPAAYSRIVQPNGRVLVPLVPDSCCAAEDSNCGHSAWLLANKSNSWADVVPADSALIHAEGCSPAIINVLARDLLAFRLLLVAILLLQLASLICSRYVYSSTINSLMLGRPKGKAVGWLIGNLRQDESLYKYDNVCDGNDSVSRQDFTKKQKCNIFSSFGRKGKKEAETSTPKSKRGRFRPPCITKLTQKCKKSNTSKRGFESKTNMAHDSEGRQATYHVYNYCTDSKSDEDDGDETVPLFKDSRKVQVYKMSAKPHSPFTKKEVNPGENKIHVPFNSSRTNNPVDLLTSCCAQDSESEKDFKKARNKFESGAIRVSPKTFYAPYNKLKPKKECSVNFIDLEGSPIVTNNSTKTAHSPKVKSVGSDSESVPIVLRNYRIPPEA